MFSVKFLTFLLASAVSLDYANPEPWRRVSNNTINPESCGLRTEYTTGKIIGGTDSTTPWPWMVGIGIAVIGKPLSLFCGGSLIDDRHVLTAAHCFDEYNDTRRIEVIIGESNRESPRTRKIEWIKKHENYHGSKYVVSFNDIAMLGLRDRAPENAVPICLPPPGQELRDGDTVTLIGFGDLEEGSESPKVLQEVDNLALTCEKAYGVVTTDNRLRNRQMCTVHKKEETKTFCSGDSGGPVAFREGGRWWLMGIMSYNRVPCGSGVAGVHTKVSPYREWIDRTIARTVPRVGFKVGPDWTIVENKDETEGFIVESGVLTISEKTGSERGYEKLPKTPINGEGCGLRTRAAEQSNFKVRITAGTESTAPWPWMVGIIFGRRKRDLCGGSLIDDRHVLTAAHCLETNNTGFSGNPGNLRVVIGELSLDGYVRKSHRIEWIKVHENYSKRPYYSNDIALLRLRDGAPKNAVPICLPPSEKELGEEDTLTILGYGATEQGGDMSQTLREVHKLPVISISTCETILKRYRKGYAEVTSRQICTLDEKGVKGPCQGDSGGPLAFQEEGGRWWLMGLVSYGVGECPRPGRPAVPEVYTRVASYRDWVDRSIAEGEEGGDRRRK